MESLRIHLLSPDPEMFDVILISILAIVIAAALFRHIPSIPEPERPLKTPFGKVPFFDGVALYGIAALSTMVMLRFIGSFL